MTEHELTRRRLLALGLALPPLAALAGSDLFAGELLAATPAIADDDDPTPAQTEGPYFTPNSPLRRSIVPAGAAGIRLTLTGRVLTTASKPVARALVDFWQASAAGVYDNSGYRFRGHQFTDANGRYSLTTVVPGLYSGRTKHIHVKVQKRGGSILTTQLYFPGVAGNRSDRIFRSELLVRNWRKVGSRRAARKNSSAKRGAWPFALVSSRSSSPSSCSERG